MMYQCAVCGKREDVEIVQNKPMPLPKGWATVMLSQQSQQTIVRLLCADDVPPVREAIRG